MIRLGGPNFSELPVNRHGRFRPWATDAAGYSGNGMSDRRPSAPDLEGGTMTQHIREIMTTDLVTVDPLTSVVDVAQLMRRDDVGDVLVVDEGRLFGVVTDRDLVIRVMAEGGNVGDRTVASACSKDLVTVTPDDDVDQVIGLMRERAVRRVPVIEGDHPVGVVSLGDLAIERDPRSVLGDISSARPNE